MKNLFLIAALIFSGLQVTAQADLDYYLPDNVNYDASIPTPESVFGFQVGEWLVSHDQVVEYMKAIEASSDRAVLIEYAHSYEDRPLFHLIFTTPENHKKLEQIKSEHVKLSDPEQSSQMNTSEMPVVVILGYSIHGNESSGVNSSLLTAYYLAAAQGPEIDKMLSNSVILVDPALNPDGITRFSTWANMHKSQTLSADPAGRGFNEVWPGGRTNHYWFDMNRDYILLTNPESRGRVTRLQEWNPNIVTDHHEMGGSSTFFFQPGIPSRNNPITPVKNYDLTHKIGAYHAKALDGIGTLYFSEEVFDDYYIGKGSSYPDINSGIGILFEQAGIRGFEKETPNGVIDFPYAIKNQFTVSLSTLRASQDLRKELLDYQVEFYNTASKQADQEEVKAYVFGDENGLGRMYEFMRILENHKIEVFQLKSDYSLGNKKFRKNYSYLVPLKQKNYRLIKGLFETMNSFNDSSFYDVSTWTLPMSFNIPYSKVNGLKALGSIQGNKITSIDFPEGKITGSSDAYAWVFRYDEYYAPKAVNTLLEKGVRVKVSTQSFTYRDDLINESFGFGTILVPAGIQDIPIGELYSLLKKISKDCGIEVYGLNTGLTPSGIDLGSGSFATLNKPRVLMLVGDGTSSRDAGEIWHLFDTRYKIPITMVDVNRFNRLNLNLYNAIILPGGSYNGIGTAGVDKLDSWIKNGGSLVAYKDAARWVSSKELTDTKFNKIVSPDPSRLNSFIDRRKESSKQYISGAIFEIKIDLSHPLAFGFQRNIMPVFKTGTTVAELPEVPYSAPFRYTAKPLLSGYTSPENIERIKNSPFLTIHNSGRGRVISIMDNTNFRGVWYGTNKIFINAIFFGHLVNSSSRF